MGGQVGGGFTYVRHCHAVAGLDSPSDSSTLSPMQSGKQYESMLLGVAYRCYHPSLYLTRSTISYVPALPLLSEPRGCTTTMPAELSAWLEAGLHTLGDLYRDGAIVPYDTLVEEEGLPTGQILLHKSLLAALGNKLGDTIPGTSNAPYYTILTGHGDRQTSCALVCRFARPPRGNTGRRILPSLHGQSGP